MLRILISIALLLSCFKINAQVQIFEDSEPRFIQAMKLERTGNVERAKELYQNILNKDPSHQPSYFQLKNIYNKNGEFDLGIKLIKSWLNSHPSDHQSELSLGEFDFRDQQQKNALEIWKNFEEERLTNKTMFRLLFHSYVKFGQTDAMESLSLKGREQFDEPYFLAIDLANYYQSRQAYDRALRELIILIQNQKQYLRYATDRILIMSDDTSSHAIIDSILIRNQKDESELGEILAAFYYKIGDFQKSFDQYKLIDMNLNKDKWIRFSEDLRKEKEYALSIEAYHLMLEGIKTSEPSLIGKILLGLGKAYEDQIIQKRSQLQFVRWYPENSFFNNQLIDQSLLINNESLASSLEHYQSILALMPNTRSSAEVHYRLAQIQSRIMRDFFAARSSFEIALKLNPSTELRKKIQNEIGNLLIFSGKYDEAIQYFKPEANEEFSYRTVGYINSLLYSSQIDSAVAFLDSNILKANPNEAHFNDIFEIHDMIIDYYTDGTREDKLAFELFFKAEKLINEFDVKGAVKVLQTIEMDYNDSLVSPLASLRLAFIFIDLKQYDKSLEYALAVSATSLKDKGLALAAEIEEHFLKSKDNALQYYYRLLSESPNSILSGPVRLHIRKISQPNES